MVGWLCAGLVGCVAHDHATPAVPSDYPSLSVSQAWDVMQAQGLKSPSLGNLKQDRILNEFDRLLGYRSGLSFKNRKDFEDAAAGVRTIELNRVANSLPGPLVSARWQTYGAWIAAIGSSFDDKFRFYPPYELDQANKLVSGADHGVGIRVGFKDGSSIVGSTSVLGSARNAGVSRGGRILSVKENGMEPFDLSSSSPQEVQEMLDGPMGGDVTVEIFSSGNVQSYPLSRSRWIDPSIHIRITKQQGFDLISVPRFYMDGVGGKGSTSMEYKAALDEARDHPYVLDLRGNKGGGIDQVGTMASLSGASGLLWTVSSRRAKAPFVASKSTYRHPLAVWVGEDTSAAAQLLAGALQSHGVLVVGVPPTEDATLQLMIPLDQGSFLSNGKSATGTLVLTTARLSWGEGIVSSLIPDCPMRKEVAQSANKQYSRAMKNCLAGLRG